MSELTVTEAYAHIRNGQSSGIVMTSRVDIGTAAVIGWSRGNHRSDQARYGQGKACVSGFSGGHRSFERIRSDSRRFQAGTIMNGGPVITIANWAGVNLGDDAVFIALLDSINRHLLPSRVYVLADNEHEIFRRYRVDGAASIFEFYRPAHLPRVMRFLGESDLVVYGGGDLINGNVASMTFITLAKRLGVPVMCCGVGVLPITSPGRRMLTVSALNAVDLITVRDRESKERLDAMGVSRPRVHVTADPAFMLSARPPSSSFSEPAHGGSSMTVGINIRTQDRMYSEYASWDRASCVRVFREVCDRLIRERDARILFIPMETYDRRKRYHHQVFDDVLGREIREGLERPERFVIIDGMFSPEEMKALLGTVDLLISMRLHTLLMASEFGTPMVAFDYAPKVRSFMSMIGRQEHIVSMEKFGPEEIMAAIDRAMAATADTSHARQLRERSMENISLMKEVLNSGRKERAGTLRSVPAVASAVLVNLIADGVQAVRGAADRV